MIPKRESFTLSEIEKSKDHVFTLHGKRLSAADLLKLAVDEAEDLPIYHKPKPEKRNDLVGLAVNDGTDSSYGYGLARSPVDDYVRVYDFAMLKAVAKSLEDTGLARIGKRRLRLIALDGRNSSYTGGNAADSPPFPWTDCQGKVSPRKWLVFTEDLERVGVVVDPLPVPDASCEDAQEEPTAEPASAPETVNTQAAKRRSEKMWLHVAVTVLAEEWARKGAARGGPYLTEVGKIKRDGAAQKIAWLTGDSPAGVRASPELLRKYSNVLKDCQMIIEGEGAEAKLTTGLSTLKKAMEKLSKAVFPDEPEDTRAGKILALIAKAAPDFEPPPSSLIADKLKGG